MSPDASTARTALPVNSAKLTVLPSIQAEESKAPPKYPPFHTIGPEEQAEWRAKEAAMAKILDLLCTSPILLVWRANDSQLERLDVASDLDKSKQAKRIVDLLTDKFKHLMKLQRPITKERVRTEMKEIVRAAVKEYGLNYDSEIDRKARVAILTELRKVAALKVPEDITALKKREHDFLMDQGWMKEVYTELCDAVAKLSDVQRKLYARYSPSLLGRLKGEERAAGAEGLLRAIEKFEMDKGFSFKTYAGPHVKAAVKEFVDNELARIGVSGRQIRPVLMIKGCWDIAHEAHGRNPTMDELLTAINETAPLRLNRQRTDYGNRERKQKPWNAKMVVENITALARVMLTDESPVDKSRPPPASPMKEALSKLSSSGNPDALADLLSFLIESAGHLVYSIDDKLPGHSSNETTYAINLRDSDMPTPLTTLIGMETSVDDWKIDFIQIIEDFPFTGANYKHIIVLRYLNGLSPSDIGKRLRIPTPHVLEQERHALAELRASSELQSFLPRPSLLNV